MGKLRVITSGVETSGFNLTEGVHRVGRAADNDWVIEHDSVSTHHCAITVREGAVRLQDLGSTNGSFVDGNPVSDVPIILGQRLRLGDVEIDFEPEEVFQAGGVSLKRHEPRQSTETESSREFADRFVHKLNRPSAAVQMEMPESFYAALRTAFAYPFRAGAWLLLLIGTVFFGLLEVSIFVLKWMLSSGILQLMWYALLGLVILTTFTAGYLYAYMQRIILCTVGGDHDLPDWPEFSSLWADMVLPAFQNVVVWFVCLVPSQVFMWYAPDSMTLVAVPLALAGMAYLPMAFLAVALLDTLGGLNPLVVVPSMLKVPKPYLAVCGVLLLILIFQFLARLGLEWLLGIPILPGLICGFFSFYFVCVMVRILGLLYLYHREELQWI